MGAACSCMAAPKAQGDERLAPPAAAAAATAATAAGSSQRPAAPTSGSDVDAASPRHSLGWHSVGEGASTDIEEDEWHDALSELGSDDLADALSGFEQERHFHDPAIDRAIAVLKAHGQLVPSEVEHRVSEDRAAERLLHTSVDAAARVALAPPPPKPALPAPLLERTRSQRLAGLLREPHARSLLAEAAELAASGRVLAAKAKLEALLAAAGGGSLAELAALPADALAAALPAGASLDVAGIAADAEYVGEALAALEDHQGWMNSRSDSLKVFYRHQRGTTQHSLKFRAVFTHPLEHLLALAYEFDLIPTWNRFSLAAVKLHEPSIFESFVYGAQWMPKPFRHMQGLLRCRGFDLADEHRCLLVSLDDCAPGGLPAAAAPLPPEFGKRKLVNFLRGSCIKLRPLPAAPDGTPRCEGSLLIHLDPHIPFLPAFLLNFVLGVLAPYVYNQILHLLDNSFADEASTYAQRIAAQPQLYGLVQARMAQYQEELRPQTEEEAAAEAAAGKGSARHKSRGRLGSATATP